MKKTPDLFDSSGWMIAPSLIGSGNDCSVVVADLPDEGASARLDKFLFGANCKVSWRNVERNCTKRFECKSILFSKGTTDELMFEFGINPLIIQAPARGLVFFKHSANEFYIVSGGREDLETVLSKSTSQARTELHQFISNLQEAGKATFRELEKVYFRD